MNHHPYLRAYMAGIAVPTPLLLFVLAMLSIVRFVCNIPIPLERVIIFPMAIVPNLFGLWNMLYLASYSCTRLPLGIHGAILPFLLAPAGYLLARALGFLQTSSRGFVYFGVVEIPYVFLMLGFSVGVIIYYLVWKYLIGFFNHVAGLAE
jgi:hypothetical protein